MIFSLNIYAPPSAQGSRSALKFAQAVLAQGHELYRVFFYHDAVYSANSETVTPQDEKQPYGEWVSLAEKHNLDLVVCIAAALRRGILDSDEADRYEKAAVSVEPPFVLSGLGQLIDATVHSDRVITFG